ncbi:hypothetical protein CU098_013951, partial [Rhizopus stolonifer]
MNKHLIESNLLHNTGSEKDIKLDNSIYKLLSMYLTTDSLPPVKNHRQSSQSTHIYRHRRQNWLGETTQRPSVLEKNTLMNSKSSSVIEPIKKNKTQRSVSFSETVTILSRDNSISLML